LPVSQEAIALASHERQPHLATYHVQVSLDLAFTQRELIGELLSALAWDTSDIFDELPNPPKSLGSQALVVWYQTIGVDVVVLV
jgi:hypothetical protein